MSRYKVTRLSQVMVLPRRPATPTGELPLSSIDKALGLRNMTELVQVFRCGNEPAKVIAAALSSALVPYYPVAGRVLESSLGELHVACTGEGVWFAEATADCSLEDVNYLAQPLLIPTDHLLPSLPAENKPTELTLMIQVTKFVCGGFVVGFGFNHAVFDGFGVMQFFRAVGEIARGFERPTIEPIWCREVIPGPPRPATGPSSPLSISNLRLQWSTMDVSKDHIDRIKDECMKETGRTCSDFDVLVAVLWQCRTRAISTEPLTQVHLSCPTNARSILREELPSHDGYYGNCTFHAIVTAPAGTVAQAPIGDIVGMILDAKERIPSEFWKWMRGELQEKTIASFCNYETIVVSDIGRLGCHEVDYGWGAPIQTGMMRSSDHMASCVVDCSPAAANHGVRITGRFVRAEHLTAFRDEMTRKAKHVLGYVR